MESPAPNPQKGNQMKMTLGVLLIAGGMAAVYIALRTVLSGIFDALMSAL